MASGDVGVGRIVRVPLGGRVVRGFVVGRGEDTSGNLREIRGTSGAFPVFGTRLLEVLRWAALHYVAPLAVMLGRTSPPNLPFASAADPVGEAAVWQPTGALSEVAVAAAAGRHLRPHYLVAEGDWETHLAELCVPVLGAGRSALVLVPTGAELDVVAKGLPPLIADRLEVVGPGTPARDATRVWSRVAVQPGVLLLGTPRVTLWPAADLSLLVVVEEGRRAMKERQTPTLHVRDVAAKRAVVERLALAYLGRVPTTEILAAGVAVVSAPGRVRAWPLVEIVDRGDDPPDGSLLAGPTRAALRAAVAAGRRVFVFTHRHGYSAASRCARCRELRTCHVCGARPDPGSSCRRCGAPLGPCSACGGETFFPLGAGVGRVSEAVDRLVGAEASGITVGTERDLAGTPRFDLAVVVDADGLILGTNYRAAEDALRVLVRVASAVGRGKGRRAMVQTVRPDHEVIRTLVRGDPLPFLSTQAAERASLRLPPSGELMVVEASGEPAGFDDSIRSAAGSTSSVLGPAATAEGNRWLIQGPDLLDAKLRLREIVQRARDGGGRVRIDVDPIDL